ncbi:PREDICTED: myozenin-3 [Dipodomys ordii]|uniref:Myozenin-3 n=1 Tax=Dipodomys ordii TaxID=10020 RepID=A0A1S3FYL5_DIPOR|nr:PREDICTED: myozenin-3 [Dipodomys ordii]
MGAKWNNLYGQRTFVMVFSNRRHLAHDNDTSVPLLDLGKKLKVPQDLMIEELSLRNNRGSLLFQKRQRRVQRFTFEFEASQPGVNGGRKRRRQGDRSGVWGGYAEPLKSVPPEKFNHTSIPKGYRCPWQELVSHRELADAGRSHAPRLWDLRNFNKTPVPFGGPLVGETIPRAGTPFVPEPFSGLELLRLRPNFNRVAQGWVRKLPESEEL